MRPEIAISKILPKQAQVCECARWPPEGQEMPLLHHFTEQADPKEDTDATESVTWHSSFAEILRKLKHLHSFMSAS